MTEVVAENNPLGVGKNLEAIRAGDGEEGNVGGFGDFDREGGWGRDGDDDAGAEAGGFLHHFDGNATGQQQRTRPRIVAGATRSADQLVEGIVAADILAHRDEAVTCQPQPGGMDSVGFGVKPLRRTQCRHGGRDVTG